MISCAVSHAQIQLPPLNAPGQLLPLPSRPPALPLNSPAAPRLEQALPGAAQVPAIGVPAVAAPELRELRLLQNRELLRLHGDLLEPDPRGEPIVRREILAWSPNRAGREAAAAAGLQVVREQSLDELGQALVVMRVPEHADTADMLETLRQADPQGIYDFNHIYTGSGTTGAPASPAPSGKTAMRNARTTVIGLVDSGIDMKHEAFRRARIERWGCDALRPAMHGTAVAALMVGDAAGFRGVAPHARLYAADVYCGSGTGGSVERIAAALAWLAKEKVAVINVSLVGPPNRMLELAVEAMVGRGHLLVAAVGNDGPAAPPLYPASYRGVVGVTAVDARGRPLPEAARGRQVMFAAPGSDMASASPDAPPWQQVRGTSFAAPIVAALLATKLTRPDPVGALHAIAWLAGRATREVPPLPREEIGYGLVGESYRNPAAH